MRRWVVLIMTVALFMGYRQFYIFVPAAVGEEAQATAPLATEILLVPLDSRPPCREFVVKAGQIASCGVITPPHELQDYYSDGGDCPKIRAWLADNIAGKQAAILSVDQLLFGGLLAARESEFSPTEADKLLEFLRELHQKNPAVPLYAFSILPRLTPQDTIDDYRERRALMEYSRLMGKKGAGLWVDEENLRKLRQSISPLNLAKYTTHFEHSRELGEKLAKLTQEGVLAGLVLGQDDGEPYSIPNLAKEKLKAYLKHEKIGAEQVFLLHGADEIALLILAKLVAAQQPLTAYVDYNTPATADTVMPYMAINMRETVEERLRFLSIDSVKSAEQADFVLSVSANNSDTLDSRSNMLKRLRQLAVAQKNIALIDLSYHFTQGETLLPLLLKNDYPLNSLTAYAGWNTAGNAVGTAMAQATIYVGSLRQDRSTQERSHIIARNLTFLHERILEDNFYLKDVIDSVNGELKQAGYLNTADLDLNRNYHWANYLLRREMNKRLTGYKFSRAFRQPVTLALPDTQLTVQTTNLVVDMSYPWPRTFEIALTGYLNVTAHAPK